MSPPKRTPETTDALRASLVDHARRLIARDGASALTMRSLATEAGCAVGLPYKVFVDRHDLVVEICHAEFAGLQHAFDDLPARAGHGTVGGNLAWIAERFLDTPAVALAPEIMADVDLSKAVAARAHQSGSGPATFETAFARYLTAEQGAGRVASDVDEKALAFLLAGAVHNLVVSGDAWPRPSRAQLRRWLDAIAATISPQ